MFAFHALRETLLVAYFVFLREPADSVGMFFQSNLSQRLLTSHTESIAGRSSESSGQRETNDAFTDVNYVDRCDLCTDMPEVKAVQTVAETSETGAQFQGFSVAHKSSQTVLEQQSARSSLEHGANLTERPLNKPLERLSRSVPKSIHAGSILPAGRNVPANLDYSKTEESLSTRSREEEELNDIVPGADTRSSERIPVEPENQKGVEGLRPGVSFYSTPEVSMMIRNPDSAEEMHGNVQGAESERSCANGECPPYNSGIITGNGHTPSASSVPGKTIPSDGKGFFLGNFLQWLEEAASIGFQNYYLVFFLIVSVIVLLHAGIFSYHQNALESIRHGRRGVNEQLDKDDKKNLMGGRGTEDESRESKTVKADQGNGNEVNCGHEMCSHRKFEESLADPPGQLHHHPCQFLSSYLLA